MAIAILMFSIDGKKTWNTDRRGTSSDKCSWIGIGWGAVHVWCLVFDVQKDRRQWPRYMPLLKEGRTNWRYMNYNLTWKKLRYSMGCIQGGLCFQNFCYSPISTKLKHEIGDESEHREDSREAKDWRVMVAIFQRPWRCTCQIWKHPSVASPLCLCQPCMPKVPKSKRSTYCTSAKRFSCLPV